MVRRSYMEKGKLIINSKKRKRKEKYRKREKKPEGMEHMR